MNKEDLLYHYFSNSLSEAQEAQLQELLKTDTEFIKQFEYESNLKRVVKEARHKRIKSKLNRFEGNINQKKTNQKVSFTYLKIAASIVVLISFGWLGYQNFYSIDYSDLYTENYNTYPNTVYTITRSDTINSIEREAFVAYEAENYKLALEKFNSAETKDYFGFYKAQSYLMLNREGEAKLLFENIIEQKKQFEAESYWYIGLIQIKEKDKEDALYYLRKLVAGFDYRKKDAQKLVKKLE